MNQKPKLIAIVGPTASGKTSLSIKLAKKFNGEIISADSRQVYRHLNIGTGKVTESEAEGIPHHLIDIVEPMDVYTAVDFQHDSTAAILRIQNRNHLPIIAGGTHFYLQLLRGHIKSAPVPPDESFRQTLTNFSNLELLEKLQATDPNRAQTIDHHNRRRLIRALEIINILGYVPEPDKPNSPYEWLIIGVAVPKDILLTNFTKRLEHWLEEGFKKEVEQLLKEGIPRDRFKEFGFEYILMLELIDGKITLDEFKEKFVQKNWQYAKRQMTWLKRDGEIEWYSPENYSDIFQRVETFLHQPGS